MMNSSLLLKALEPATRALTGKRGHGRRRHAELATLPALRPVAAKPAAVDWLAAYPCTRMHGAAFEAEFYAGDTELPGF